MTDDTLYEAVAGSSLPRTIAPATPAPQESSVTQSRLVRGRSAAIALALCLLPLHAALADDSIDPSLIPDGSYPAHVDKIINAQHIEVTMQGTLKVFLTAGRANITFVEKIKANDDVIVTLADGKVVAYAKK